MVCHECGKVNGTGVKFCAECGASLLLNVSATSQPLNMTNQQETYKSQQNSDLQQNMYVQQSNGSVQPGMYAQQPNGSVQPGMYAQQPNGSVRPGMYAQQPNGSVQPGMYAQQPNGSVRPEMYAQQPNGSVRPEMYVQQPNGNMQQNMYVQQPNGNMQQNMYMQPQKSNNSPAKIIIGIVVAVVVLGLGFTIIFPTVYMNNKKKNEDNGSATQNVVQNDSSSQAVENEEKDVENKDESVGVSKKDTSFKFENQSLIYFNDDKLLIVDPSIMGKSYDEINSLFGGDLPKTQSVDWWYNDFGEYYDWTEYKEAGGDLEKHGINFMFLNNKLCAIAYDKHMDSGDKIVNAAKKKYGAAMTEQHEGVKWYFLCWNTSSGLGFDIHYYNSAEEGDMYSQRYGIWEWN